MAAFTRSLFVPRTGQAVSTTRDGHAVLWEDLVRSTDAPGKAHDKRAAKLLKYGALERGCGESVTS